MSKSNISEALGIGWFIAAGQFQSGALGVLFYFCLALGFLCLVLAMIITITEPPKL